MSNLEIALAVLGGCVTLGGLAVTVLRTTALLTRIHDSLLGSSAQPGLIRRMEVVEARTMQLMPNDGSHLADKINRTREDVQRLVNAMRETDFRAAEHRGATDAQLLIMQHDIRALQKGGPPQ